MKTAFRIALFAVAVLAVSAPDHASAWSALRCGSNPDKLIRYPGNGMPWPMRVRDNVPAGSMARESLENSVALWNSTVGALDVLTLQSDGYNKCKAPDNAGYGVVGVDTNGACSEKLGFDWWGSGANGVRQYWVQDCQIVATTLYANPSNPNSEEEMGDIMSHELGHHMGYAHNWYGVSVMGYGVNMYWYLTSEDQGYIRTRFPSGTLAGPDPHIHRTVLLTALGKEIEPDVHSQTTAPDPTCLPGDCKKLRAGSTIRAILTYGNAGDTAINDPIRISMYLGEFEIAAWATGALPAHSSSTYEFQAKVPEGIPAGDYVMRMEVDSEHLYQTVMGPSPTRVREFPGFRVLDSACPAGGCGDIQPEQQTATLPVVSAAADEAVTAEGLGGAGNGTPSTLQHHTAGCAVSRDADKTSALPVALVVAGAMLARRMRRRRA